MMEEVERGGERERMEGGGWRKIVEGGGGWRRAPISNRTPRLELFTTRMSLISIKPASGGCRV